METKMTREALKSENFSLRRNQEQLTHKCEELEETLRSYTDAEKAAERTEQKRREKEERDAEKTENAAREAKQEAEWREKTLVRLKEAKQLLEEAGVADKPYAEAAFYYVLRFR